MLYYILDCHVKDIHAILIYVLPDNVTTYNSNAELGTYSRKQSLCANRMPNSPDIVAGSYFSSETTSETM